jgi:two-component sensor histidine kinase
MGGILGFKRRHLYSAYLLIGSLIIFLSISAISFRISERMEEQAQLTTWLLSSFTSQNIGQGDSEQLKELVTKIHEIEVPFIVTDIAGRPMLWNEPIIGIDMPDQMLVLQSVNPAGGNSQEIERILRMIKDFDKEHEPFAIINPASGVRVGTLHYGSSGLIKLIRWLPYGEMLLLGAFFSLIVWARGLKRETNEQKLFAGMAKETAHQLGTPLTSIMGWIELLRDKLPQKDVVVEEIDRDVTKLRKVSERFSQIGSQPQLQDSDIEGVVQGVVSYFKHRMPHLGGKVEISFQSNLKNRCRFNRDLIEWVLENLIKNSLDAMKGKEGAIELVVCDADNKAVVIKVIDNGSGIPTTFRNLIFDAGFTTKSRGWGMGLALVKRIVVDYHNGKISIADTGSHGTTFEIKLPGEDK